MLPLSLFAVQTWIKTTRCLRSLVRTLYFISRTNSYIVTLLGQRVIKHRRTSYDLMKEYINPGTLTEKELK